MKNKLRSTMLLVCSVITSNLYAQNYLDEIRMVGFNCVTSGQKQEVVIARTLMNAHLIIVGDEPTGNLDKKNSDIVFDIFKELTKSFHQTLSIVIHDNEFAERTHRIIEMENGRIISSSHSDLNIGFGIQKTCFGGIKNK